MTELQNNDLVSKLGAASPVEPTQANQINLSDNYEMDSTNQAPLNVEPVINDATPQDSIGNDVPLPANDETINVNVPPVEEPAPVVTNKNSVASPDPVEPVIRNEEVVTNNVVPAQSVNNGAIAGNSINNVVNADPQKVSNISKRNPRAEYWKGLASGVLISIGLVIIGLMFFDNGSLLTAAANSIKLTNDDTVNEVVKMEDALAFGDSLSDSYIGDIIGDSDEEIENGGDGDEVSLDSPDTEADDVLDTEYSNDEEIEIVKTDVDDEDTTEVVALDDTLEDESSDTDKKSTKSKMAGSIVSIFDEVDDDAESDRTETENSDEEVSPISYEHVDNIEDANWVMSANCDNLHCGNISGADPEELVLCTEFRQSDKLDDNTNRIGSNGVCRYKDASELVHIEL